VLKFRSQRTAGRPKPGNGSGLQRRGVWLAMALMLVAIFFGQSAWRKHNAAKPAPTDGHLTDNIVEKKPADKDADRLIMPGDLKGPELKPVLPVDGKRLFGGVMSKVFADVSDDSAYRGPETDAIFTLLKALRHSDERDIELASIGRLTFVQLQEQSADYRGEIVTVGGVVERILPQTNPKPNAQGIEKQYEVWIRPDGGRLPIVALCLDLPPDYPTGTKPTVDVSGYFFKRLGYPSAEKASGAAQEKGMTNVFRSAPLVLAKTLKVRAVPLAPAAAAVDEGPEFLRGIPLPIPAKYVLPLIGIGMIVTVALSAWAFRLSRSSAMGQGPIVGRHRRDEESAAATNLNSLDL